uniref:CesA-4 n=1 Tax=Arundo donax TaxID=35708 RepID=A0A0A9FV83_ARUDO
MARPRTGRAVGQQRQPALLPRSEQGTDQHRIPRCERVPVLLVVVAGGGGEKRTGHRTEGEEGVEAAT